MLSTTIPNFISMSNYSLLVQLIKLISEVAVPEGRNKPQCLLVQQKVAHLNDVQRGAEGMGNTQPFNQPEGNCLALSVTYYWLLACAVSETEIIIPDVTRELVAKIDDLPVKATNVLDSKIERNASSLECDDFVESAVFRTSERTVTDNRSTGQDSLDGDVISPLVEECEPQHHPAVAKDTAHNAIPTEASTQDPLVVFAESDVENFIEPLDISTAEHRGNAATAIVGRYDLGVVSTLLQLLRVANKDTSVQAAGVLRGLAGTNPDARSRLVAARGIPLIVKLLTTEDSRLLEHVIGVLANMALDSESGKAIAIAGALPLLVELLSKCDDVKIVACVALGRLASRKDVVLAIHDTGVVSMLVTLLRSGTHPVKVKAAGTLAALAAGPNTAKKIALAGAIPLLVQLVPDYCNSEKANVLVALQNLAVDDENNDGILAEDALPLLLQLLMEGDDFTQTVAASTLGNLAMTKHIAVLIAEAGPHRTLVNILAHGSADAKKYALKLIYNLLSVPAFDTDIVAAGSVPHLIALLSSNHEPTVTATATTIAKLSKQPSANDALIEAGALAQLGMLINDETVEAVQEPAATALQSICTHTTNVQAILDTKVLLLLVQRMSKGNDKAKVQNIGVLSTLARQDHRYKRVIQRAGARRIAHSQELRYNYFSVESRVHKQFAHLVKYNPLSFMGW